MKVLLINSVCGIGSTGRICTDIADELFLEGHEVKIAYGRGNVPNKYKKYAIKIGSKSGLILHGLYTRLFDKHGFGSKIATKKFLKRVKKYNPDIIHLHNLHGYYINVEILFDYLKKANKPIVWTLHDCWAFTGHCSHFTEVKCEQWKTHCSYCVQKNSYPASLFIDNCKRNFERKKNAFTGVNNLTIITPSKWLKGIVEKSFLNEYPVYAIANGIDLDVFKPTESDFKKKYNLLDKKIVLGVAQVWSERKGLNDFIELSKKLPQDYQVVLVGLTKEQIQNLPKNILAFERTSSAKELAEIYTVADVFVNPSVEETMGLTTAEALACGTPAMVYDKTAVPEVVDDKSGIVVSAKNVDGLIDAIKNINLKEEDCINRAKVYDKIKKYKEYLEIYKEVYENTICD